MAAEPETEEELDVTDPAYWARPEFAVKPVQNRTQYSKLCCLSCKDGAAYGDGAGGYTCYRCGWSSQR